ncbi:hypothetical protein MASR1M74_07500 [Lentimicrobium sp.]
MCCFVAPPATNYIFLQFQKKQIKKSVKRKFLSGIDKDELTLLKFTEAEKKTRLRWKHSREFEFEGMMYDIGQSKTEGDTTFYWCYPDHEETQINKKLLALLDFTTKSNPLNKERHKRLSSFLKSLYFSKSDSEAMLYQFEFHNYWKNPPTLYPAQFCSPAEPPPKS